MDARTKRALSFWQVAFQYLDLSENVAKLISESGNRWVFIQEGWDTNRLEEVHIPAHRDRPFRLNVTACSGRS